MSEQRNRIRLLEQAANDRSPLLCPDVVLRPSPLREWLREWSAARRESRRRALNYGATLRLYRQVPEFVTVIAPIPDKGPRRRRKTGPFVHDEAPDGSAEARREVISYIRKRNIELRARLVEAQDGRCYLCGFPFSDERPATLDHVTPRAMRGRTRRNVLAAHEDCNRAKADRSPHLHELAKLAEINAVIDGEA